VTSEPNNRDTVIITVDDDKVYRPGLVADLLEAHVKHPGAVVGFAGSSTSNASFCLVQCLGFGEVEVPNVEGFGAVLYPREALGDAEVFEEEFRSLPTECIPADDYLQCSVAWARGASLAAVWQGGSRHWRLREQHGLAHKYVRQHARALASRGDEKYQACLSAPSFEGLNRLGEAFRALNLSQSGPYTVPRDSH